MNNPQMILTDTHSFMKFRTEDCIYVDKTRFAYDLLENKMTQCFLSRPRRFGKSLFLTMLKEMFLGNKAFFKGLYIYDKYDFKPYPVIHLSFTLLEYSVDLAEEKALHFALTKYLSSIAEEQGLEKLNGPFLGTLIKNVHKKFQSPIVLLIDEYDKPLLNNMNAPESRKKVLNVYKNLFSPLKDLTDKIKFLFITGVSKFSQVSIFSDLNNLDDLTMNENYSTIAGFTRKEIECYFKDYIPRLADHYGKTTEEILNQIKTWYDGYSWDGKNFVYAPFSISNLFKHCDFRNYWFNTATPSFLIDVIDELKKGSLSFESFESFQMYTSDLEKYNIDTIQLMPLLFQAGYLSVHQKDKNKLIVHFPNQEVREAFNICLFNNFSSNNFPQISNLQEAIEKTDVDKMMKCIKSIIATIPYQILDKKENVYHSHVYTILKTINKNTHSEISTNLGRIDTVMETQDTIYIFEFKMKSALDGIRQIKHKRYAEGYFNQNKKLVLIGVKFSKADRNIADYKYEFLGQHDETVNNHSELSFTEQILVLYSKQDESFKEKLMMHLQPIKKFGIAIFDDITFDEILLSQSISNTRNINILLSPHFLASDLFQSPVLEGLPESNRQQKIHFFPIVVQPCAYKVIPWMTNMDTNPEPLATLSQLKQDEILADIVVKNAIKLQ
jgi:hypothetical protein